MTCAGECSGATAIPSASSAGVYGDGPPGSQPVTIAPACAARSAAALAPAPAAPTTWIRSPARIGRAARAGCEPGPDPIGARTVTRRPVAAAGDGPTRRLRRVPAGARAPPPRCAACSRPGRRSRRSAGRRPRSRRRRRRTSAPPASTAIPPSGPAIPVTETARSAPVRSRPPVAIAIATWAETAPCAARTSSGTPTSLALERRPSRSRTRRRSRRSSPGPR